MKSKLRALYMRARKLPLILGWCTLAWGAQAQDYPSKNITIIVPFAAGGATDTLAREMADGMRKELNQSVIVENKPGAGTTIASSFVAKAKPDGYTILMAASSFGIAPMLYPSAGYDPVKDFEPVTLLASLTHVLVTSPEVPARNVPELIAWIKGQNGNASYASVGAGTTTHLEAELFRKSAGLELAHVPYKGSQPALVDVAAGRVPLMFDAYATSGVLAKDGRVKILGVTTRQRAKSLPQIPSIAEQGLPDFDVMTWMGFLVPKGTPEPAVRRLNQTLQKILARPEVATKLAAIGFETIGYAPNEFKSYLAQDVERWSRLIQEQKINLN